MKYSTDKLKKIKTEKGINGNVLAELIQVNSPAYYKKENMQIKFSLDEAKIIADYVGESIESLFYA